MGTTNVYCEVREESVYITEVLRGSVMAQSVSRRPLIAKAPVQFQFSRREICSGQSGIWTCFSPSTSVFPFQYYFTNSPNSYASTWCCYQKHCHPSPPPPKRNLKYTDFVDPMISKLWRDLSFSLNKPLKLAVD